MRINNLLKRGEGLDGIENYLEVSDQPLQGDNKFVIDLSQNLTVFGYLSLVLQTVQRMNRVQTVFPTIVMLFRY